MPPDSPSLHPLLHRLLTWPPLPPAGLQGIVEHFGGQLGKLQYPMHGKPSPVQLIRSEDKLGVFEVRRGQRCGIAPWVPISQLKGRPVLQGVADSFVAGRYHSLYGIREGGKWPSCLVRLARRACK